MSRHASTLDPALLKFNLVHRSVLQNIMANDSRVQQRALSVLYQTISEPSKKPVIATLTDRDIQEFTDLLQVPILLPLKSFSWLG